MIDYAGKSLHEIDSIIHQALNGGAIDYYRGMSLQDRYDLASDVEQGNATIDQVIDTVNTWYEESLNSVESN